MDNQSKDFESWLRQTAQKVHTLTEDDPREVEFTSPKVQADREAERANYNNAFYQRGLQQ